MIRKPVRHCSAIQQKASTGRSVKSEPSGRKEDKMFKQKKQKNTAAENKLGANQKIGILFCAMVSAVATGYVPNYINQ